MELVYSTNDEPWLIDLKNDPDEVTNIFDPLIDARGLERDRTLTGDRLKKVSSACEAGPDI